MMLDSKIPGGPIADKWERRKFENKLVNPANRRKYEIIIVGTGLAGSSAAAALGEQGYRVKLFCILDSPRRAHSIAAQGGINAAKNYRNDGDSVYRLFYDTVKGGDYRSREANVYRLAQLSVDIIDQCVATGVPFAREYGGLLDNRSFGGAQVSRTFYARGQTGQTDRPAVAARRISIDAAAGRCRHGNAVSPTRDARSRRRRRARARHRDTQPDYGRARAARRAGRAALHRRLRHRVLPVDQCRELERDGRMARA
jgi:succinate dehydrogenase/fumarate reductase flavoprotein subunit